MHAPRATLAVVLSILASGVAVAAVVRTSAARDASLRCSHLSSTVVACVGAHAPPGSLGACTRHRARNDVIVWTCRE